MEIRDINKIKNNILNIAIILISALAAFNIYKNNNKLVSSLTQSKSQELQKNETINSIITLEKTTKTYKDFVNKKDISSVINILVKIAKITEVKIISVKPLGEQEQEIYIKYPFQLQITAANFKKAGKFISALESSPDIYILNSVDITKSLDPQQENNGFSGNNLAISLTLSTVLLK